MGLWWGTPGFDPSASDDDEALIQAATWKNLKVALRERGQAQGTTRSMTPFLVEFPGEVHP